MTATSYQDFLLSKKAVATPAGIEVSLDDIHPMLFEFQRTLVQWALRKGRAAIFADTGLGKTLVSVECARLAGQRTLILAPLSSEGYEAIRHGRKFVGIELKESYFRTARRNLDRIIRERTQATLFDLIEEEVAG